VRRHPGVVRAHESVLMAQRILTARSSTFRRVVLRLLCTGLTLVGVGDIASSAAVASATHRPITFTESQLSEVAIEAQMLTPRIGVALLPGGGTCTRVRTDPSCGVVTYTKDSGTSWTDPSNWWSAKVKSLWSNAAFFGFTSTLSGWLLTDSARAMVLRTTDGGVSLAVVHAPGHPVALSIADGEVWLLIGTHCVHIRHGQYDKRGELACVEELATTRATGTIRWHVAPIAGAPTAWWPTPQGNYQPDANLVQQLSGERGGLFLGVGEGKRIAFTADAGERWDITNLPHGCVETPTSDGLQVAMLSDARWIALCGGISPRLEEFVTSDGGKRWRRAINCSNEAVSPCARQWSPLDLVAASPDGRLAWAVATLGASRLEIFVSTDGGVQWKGADVVHARYPMPQVFAAGRNGAVVINGFLPAAVTENGRKWSLVPAR
jgi:hypothetical protein